MKKNYEDFKITCKEMGSITIRYKGNNKINGTIMVNDFASEFSKIDMSGNHLVVYTKTKSIISKNRIAAIYDISQFDIVFEVEFKS